MFNNAREIPFESMESARAFLNDKNDEIDALWEEIANHSAVIKLPDGTLWGRIYPGVDHPGVVIESLLWNPKVEMKMEDITVPPKGQLEYLGYLCSRHDPLGGDWHDLFINAQTLDPTRVFCFACDGSI